MIVLDTSFLYALLDSADDNHAAAAEWYTGQDAPVLATTPLVVAEVDLLARRGLRGKPAARAFRADLEAGAYDVEWHPDLLPSTLDTAERYADLGASLTDTSLVALAARVGTIRVATFDERHFRAMKPLTGEPAFEIRPADA